MGSSALRTGYVLSADALLETTMTDKGCCGFNWEPLDNDPFPCSTFLPDDDYPTICKLCAHHKSDHEALNGEY